MSKYRDLTDAETKRRVVAERDYALTSAELQTVQEENLKLRAENERMREALEQICQPITVSGSSDVRSACDDLHSLIVCKARAALAKPERATK